MLTNLLVAAWISSGGNVITDAGNPWWLSNTTDVTWCVQVDPATVSVDAERVADTFERTISYWKAQFEPEPHFRQRLGTQTFERVSCDVARVDLRLVVGEGALRPEERAYFGDRLQDVVGVAVRTEYDTRFLRGRGFIYVAGDPFELPDYRNGDTLYRPWTKDQRLFRVLAHELGHVFGAPHVAKTVMDADGPSFWARDDFFVDEEPLRPFSEAPAEFESCQRHEYDGDWLRSFLGLGPETGIATPICLKIEAGGRDSQGRLWAREGRTGEYQLVGTLYRNSWSNRPDPIVRIYLNPEQMVVTSTTNLDYANLELQNVEMSSVRLTRPDGRERTLSIKASPVGYLLVGASDEGEGLKMYNLIDSSARFGEWRD